MLVEVHASERVIEPFVAAAGRDALAEGAEVATHGVECDHGWAFAAPGDEVHHSTYSVRAIKAALGAAEHFQPFQVLHRQVAEVESAARAARIIQRNTVQEHFGEIRVTA